MSLSGLGVSADQIAANSQNYISARSQDQIIYWDSNSSDLHAAQRTNQFNACDLHATLILPFLVPGYDRPPTVQLPGLTLLSMSKHRDKYPVTRFGKTGISGFTYGKLTTAGTIGFTILTGNPFAEAMAYYATWRNARTDVAFMDPTDLPPMDMNLVFSDKRGNTSTMLVRSLTLVDNSQNVSINDIQMTEMYTFMAAKASLLVNVQQVQNDNELFLTPPNPNKVPVQKAAPPTTKFLGITFPF